MQNGEESIYVSQQQSIMSQRQEPGGRTKIENMEQCSLTVCTHGLLHKLFVQFETKYQGLTLPTMGWDILKQSLINKICLACRTI